MGGACSMGTIISMERKIEGVKKLNRMDNKTTQFVRLIRKGCLKYNSIYFYEHFYK